MDADDYCDMMLPEDDENDMTRIEQIKALCDDHSISTYLVPELLELVEEMAGALENIMFIADRKTAVFDDAKIALAKYKAFNSEVV